MREFALKAFDWFSARSNRGFATIEYGLYASMAALGIIDAMTKLGNNLAAHRVKPTPPS